MGMLEEGGGLIAQGTSSDVSDAVARAYKIDDRNTGEHMRQRWDQA